MQRNKITERREAKEAALKAKEAIQFADYLKASYNLVMTSKGMLWSSMDRAEILDSPSLYERFLKEQPTDQ